MTLTTLQALTWGTVTGAVLSALLLAATESGLPDFSQLRRTGPTLQHPLPSEPPGAVGQLKAPASATPAGADALPRHAPQPQH